LRALGATSAEKSTVSGGKLNAVKADAAPVLQAVTDAFDSSNAADVPKACSIDNPDCEACQ